MVGDEAVRLAVYRSLARSATVADPADLAVAQGVSPREDWWRQVWTGL